MVCRSIRSTSTADISEAMASLAAVNAVVAYARDEEVMGGSITRTEAECSVFNDDVVD